MLLQTLPTLEEIRAERARRRRDFEEPPRVGDDKFHAYQMLAWNDPHPIVAICAAWQSGKTVFLAPWLLREIQRKGPGDYGAFSSKYKLLERKFLPELRKTFEDTGLAEFRVGASRFIFTEHGNRIVHGREWNGDPTIIQLGHAENPDSLESATLKAVAWDECGQRLVPRQSYDTVKSRLMVNRGRMCLASRPYEVNWFEKLVTRPSPNVGVISFPSWANPANHPAEDPYWDELRAEMPLWRFVMLYEGRFTKPAGLIYDCFDWEANTCDDFVFDRSTLLYPGMDFGRVNTAGLGIGVQDEIYYAFGDYHAAQKRDYPEHIASMRALTMRCAGGRGYAPGCGGNKYGEDGWREGYRRNGMALDEPPEPSVEVQIQTVYSLMKQGRLKFFRNAASQTIEDVQHYSREVDDDGAVTDRIADDDKWHRLAALRYILSKLHRSRPGLPASAPRAEAMPMPGSVIAPAQGPFPVRQVAVTPSGASAMRQPASGRMGFPGGR